MNNTKKKKKKETQTQSDPVNINCTWHWIDNQWKKENIYIYIVKIEVPPVCIMPLVNLRLGKKIMCDSIKQYLYIKQILFCGVTH